MTIKKDKIENEKIENDKSESDESENTASDDAIGADNEKSNTIAEKLKKMGLMGSAKKESTEEGRRFSPLLITLLLAIPSAALVLYYYMPEEIDHFISSFNSSTTETNQQVNANDLKSQPQLAFQPAAGNPYPVEANRRNGIQQPAWIKQQQDQMEKRRLANQQRNADYYAANNRTVPKSAETPQWIKDRQAEIDKDRTQYRQQMEKYQQDMIKQQQEMMKQQQEVARQQQQQQWSRQPVNWPYNGAIQTPGYMKHPQRNAQQPNNIGTQNQVQQMPPNVAHSYPQNQRRVYNTYNNPPSNYYNRAPFYGYGPQPVPYGWRGYR